MGIQAAPQVKYRLIEQATANDNNLLSISYMCKIAGVSRSGYYNWLDSADIRQERENTDVEDFDKILKAYRFRGYDKGARGIHMRLLRMNVLMNVKKIRRLMRKYGLKCPIRKPNPYRQMIRAMQTSHVADNVVNREFREHSARSILLTDITYLNYRNGKCYLSTILDAYTREILAYRISESLEVQFVLDTVSELIAKHGATLDNETIVHSDQGCHYTSNAFIKALRDVEFVQSMSRKGNCWDNAPQESFFGHMKDEIAVEISKCKTFSDVRYIVDDWIDYYNNDRYQWDLKKLAPAEFYVYITTGELPNNYYRGAAPNPGV